MREIRQPFCQNRQICPSLPFFIAVFCQGRRPAVEDGSVNPFCAHVSDTILEVARIFDREVQSREFPNNIIKLTGTGRK